MNAKRRPARGGDPHIRKISGGSPSSDALRPGQAGGAPTRRCGLLNCRSLPPRPRDHEAVRARRRRELLDRANAALVEARRIEPSAHLDGAATLILRERIDVSSPSTSAPRSLRLCSRRGGHESAAVAPR